jgi:DNA-binding NarL/FixJ family response regulator
MMENEHPSEKSDVIRILLVEDHQIVREGTRQLLEQTADFKVVGEAADGGAAVTMVAELKPDLIIMDVRLPILNGLEATQRIKKDFPNVQILILSAYDDDHYVFPLLEAGASGYLLKTASGLELARAVRMVYNGGIALDPAVAHKVVHRLSTRQPYRAAGMQEGLSEREMDVLRALEKGKSNKQIGEMLHISTNTVQVHLRNIYSKLGVSDRTEALTYAIRHGWIILKEEREE